MTPRGPSADARQAGDKAASAHICICDEDPATAGLLSGHLSAAGFEVQEPLSSVAQAMGWLSIDPPDVLLLDLDMSAGGGLALLGWLRTQPLLDRVQVLMLGGGDPRSIERARQLGARGCLTKPMDEAGVVATVRRLLADRRTAWIDDQTPPDLPGEASPQAADRELHLDDGGLERLNPVVAELARAHGRETTARLLQSLQDQFARMEDAAWGRGDPQDAAHATKGAAAGLGFEAVANACSDLEAAYRTGSALGPPLRRAAEACARARREIAGGLGLAA